MARYDGEDRMETAIDPDSLHFHGLTRGLVVGDGTPASPSVVLPDFVGDEYEAYRLARHRCSWHTQNVHARFDPSGDRVLYTSDHFGYGDAYLADVPEDLRALPRCDSTEPGPLDRPQS